MNYKNYTDEDFIKAVKESFSYSGVCRLLGLTPKGGNLKTVKNKIEKMGLDKSHFTLRGWNKGLTSKDNPSIRKKAIEEILVENSKWGSHYLKLRLFKEGIKEKKCERCGRTEWEGGEIPLELHHKNGIHNDNRIENLQILCPNCHALTDNYSGKSSNRKKEMGEPRYFCSVCGAVMKRESETGKCQKCLKFEQRRVIRPTKEELEKLLKENSFLKVGKMFGISDNAVRKWCKRYGLPIYSKEYK